MEHGTHHSHTHAQTGADEKDKNLMLLQYTYDHNDHHAAELDALAGKLREAGKLETAELVEQAQEAFRRGNALLREAIHSYRK
ncbi:MAG: hypothetical protein IJ860_09810 [Eubacterium sp.]|nr:hypothetical protein [Eubacterium sp.]